MKIKFCGAARAVTGSAHLITLDSGFTILLDCGLYQGGDKKMANFNDQWFFNPKHINCVVLSHAHIDHCGRLPKLVRDGFRGTIYATHATRSLCAIMLLDSARIQERDAAYHNKKQLKKKKSKRKPLRKPLYDTADVAETMKLFCGMPYDRWFRINREVEVQYRDAGHILGSANVTMKVSEGGRDTLLGFSGDIGRPDRPILRDPQQMPALDYLITESTYGDRVHESKPQESDKMLDVIMRTCLENKGKLIIPAFSVGRTQEIVYMLDQFESAGILPKLPVYVDSPLAVNATQVFGAHPECYDNQLNEYLLIDDNPFGFNNLTYIRNVELSKQLNTSEEPCIIISSSGMMNAGRVRHHLANNISDPRHTFLIVGYCAPDTPGGMLLNGIEEIKLYGVRRPVKANIERMTSFSAHADRNEMIDFISNQKRLKNIFLVHGELDTQKAFRGAILENGYDQVEIPRLGQEFALDR
ncbi:MAG: MBL fold metallo-hydrolase [Saprospiraceae bacterium]|nr:MBL fold metallo-hydrolase [Saprospiraceae bacterium]